MRRAALVASGAAHAMLVLAILAGRAPRSGDTTRAAPSIDIAIAPPQAGPRTSAAASGAAVAHADRRAKPDPPRGATTRAARDRSAATRELGVIWEREPRGAADGDRADGGSGTAGTGRGGGFGDGLGAGGAIALPPALPAVPPAPRASRARPPILIYPRREREVDEAALFVARLAIDRDGFVAGVHLLRGSTGPRGDQAASAVWRFRYAPALDDEGRPIAATVDQRFALDAPSP